MSCFSPNSCQAVGYYELAGGEKQALVASWNGTVWSVTSVAPVANAVNVLDSVSCASATSCQAVGTYQVLVGGNRIQQTLLSRRGTAPLLHLLGRPPPARTSRTSDAGQCPPKRVVFCA